MRTAITGTGLLSALGYGATGTVAALRAGLADPRELALVVGEEEGEEIAATGYPAGDFADGFFQTGAWVRLGCGAVEDLRHHAALPAAPEFWQRTAVLAAVPIVEQGRFRWTLELAPDAPGEFLVTPLVELSAPGAIRVEKGWHASGHVALAEALLRADQGLAARQAERVVVVATDSYVDEWTLAWLASDGRLKTADRPTGLMPGEAGAALLLEAEGAARHRHATILGFVEAVALAAAAPPPRPPPGAGGADELPAPRPEGPKLGRAIAQAVRQVLPPRADRFVADLYLDLNGEEWRAHGWGHAQVHLGRELDLERCRTWLPATSLGEVGAAAAPLGASLALWNFDRDGTRDALVISVSDEGRVSAIRLSAPGGSAPAAPHPT